MKILLGIDESPHSEAAVEFVKKMAWPIGTQVLVASSVRPEVSAYTEVYAAGTAPSQQFFEEQLRHHQELVSLAEQKLQVGALKIEARVLRGDPREALLDTARTEGADLIVVGSHGRTGLAKLLLGSVASHVVTHASCSVMVVKLPRP